MAKDKSKKPKKAEGGAKKAKKAGKAKSKPALSPADAVAEPTRRRAASKAADLVRTAKDAASEIAQHPVVAEVVAATLVAAAAALRDPQKARELASSAKEGLTAASKDAGSQGNALWKLAMDVARRSVDALGTQSGAKDNGTRRKGNG